MTSKFLEPQGSFFIIKMPKQIKKVNLWLIINLSATNINEKNFLKKTKRK